VKEKTFSHGHIALSTLKTVIFGKLRRKISETKSGKLWIFYNEELFKVVLLGHLNKE
jgi:hypothetical protein